MSEQSTLTGGGPRVTLDICPQCQGLWLDAAELAAVCPTVSHLPARKDEVLIAGEPGANIPVCPRCQAVPYEVAVMENMLVDFCVRCHGVWLDGEEYDQISVARSSSPREGADRGPYRTQVDQRTGEVDCRRCSHRMALARTYVWEDGFLCPPCFRRTDHQGLWAPGPLHNLLKRLFAALLPGRSQTDEDSTAIPVRRERAPGTRRL
jgi:Zn-finger nucleic acid-binding protein